MCPLRWLGSYMVNLDSAFPALAELARQNKATLDDLANAATDHPGYLILGDACQMVRKDWGRWSHADARDYLGTLDLFLVKHPMPTKTQKAFWKKINTGTDSQFLDTICEAAWGLHFAQLCLPFVFEAKLDPGLKQGPDADFRLDQPEGSLWLDVTSGEVERPSIDPPQVRIPGFAFAPYSRDAAVAIAHKKAAAKYRDKFEPVIQKGHLKGDSVGVLLGFPKMEKNLFPGLMVDLLLGQPIQAPDGLFGDARPGLGLVWGFTLTRDSSGAYLVPSLVFPWSHPSLQEDAFLKAIRPDLLTVQVVP